MRLGAAAKRSIKWGGEKARIACHKWPPGHTLANIYIAHAGRLVFACRVRRPENFPIALTVAGSDSGGGAGIQADLKTFAALRVHGVSAVAALTAQNPKDVLGVEAASPPFVEKQLRAIFAELPPRAGKTGMLFSAEIIAVVARWFRTQRCPLVVDPVMISTSGAALLERDAIDVLTRELLPLATLVTPNAPEAEALLDMPIREPEDLRTAARRLHERFGCAALVKGGHLHGTRDAIDIFFDGETELMLSAPRVPRVKTHGTGCTYSGAITAYLARGESLARAVELGKQFITAAIATHRRAGRHDVLNFDPPQG
jgi:hydroxymethylpyrimidine/phosphomethylpyrimidine kinase